MKKKILDIVIIINLFIIFILTILVKTVDIHYNEITKSNIGLYNLNKLFLNNNINVLKIISDIIFIFSLILIIIMFILLLITHIKTKQINYKYKHFIYYIIVLFIIWILFDKVLIINYRPVLIDGLKEGSYPSTHIMVVTYVLLSFSYFLKDKIKTNYTLSLNIISVTLIILTFIGRVLSQMHWFTDGLCGLLIGILFYLLFIRSSYESSRKI